nr:unnamed protein product [Digitaria exilis]
MKDPPPELCFGRITYVDCSSWTSKRAMQKVIAQQLRLNYKTMAMFDEQDEEDDFNGVDLGSREAIRSVAIVIDRHLRESRFMMIFINGGDKEVVLELPPKMFCPKQASADADKKKGVVKTSIVSLQGCACLDNLFLRGLPNLMELDLSGCATKVLDFASMVVDVPMLKRLFLIG